MKYKVNGDGKVKYNNNPDSGDSSGSLQNKPAWTPKD